MSLKAELEELLEWYVELRQAADADDEAKPVPVTKHAWGLLSDNLTTVARHFGHAADVLETLASTPGCAVAAELGRSLQRESEDLQRRAHALTQRADSPPPVKRVARMAVLRQEIDAMPTTAASSDEMAQKKAELEDLELDDDASLPQDPRTLDDAEAFLKQASRTLETARKKVHGHHGTVAAGFLDELEVVIEMNLSLRRRCTELRGTR